MAGYRSVFAPGLFADRVALVTGGGTGIGRCIAHELAALGGTVVVAGRREGPLAGTVAEIAAAGGRADHLVLDVRDAGAVEQAVAVLLERHGRLDALVNNAGGQFPSPAEALSPNGWRSVVDLNLTGTFLVTTAAYRGWFQAHGGAVVTVAADVWNGFPLMAHSGAARAGVINLTKTLAVEWASHRVRVNAVAPGLVASSGMDTYAPEVRAAAEGIARQTPAGRMGTESETSAAVVFLLSDAAAFITGETLRVDGGSSVTKPSLVPLGQGEPFAPFDGFGGASSDGFGDAARG